MRTQVGALLFLTFVTVAASAQEVLFNDDFQGDLSLWSIVGHGTIVDDALIPGNRVLAFANTADSGNMFTPALPVDATSTYVLTFKYRGSVNGVDSGGYLWLIDPLYGNVSSCPVWGTQAYNSNVQLIDDGAWHSYELTFHVTDFFDRIGGTLKITVEDWNGAAGVSPPVYVAGDAFFDDIRLSKVGPVSAELSSWGQVKSLFR